MELTAEPAGAAATEVRPLHPSVVRLWQLVAVVRTVLLAGGVAVAGLFVDVPIPFGWIAGALVLLGAVRAAVHAPAAYRRWGFQVRDADVLVRRGVLWRTVSVVPHGRIQHVDTSQGPLERAFGLSSLVLYTAGSVGAALTVPGLATADAAALRDQLALLSGADDVAV